MHVALFYLAAAQEQLFCALRTVGSALTLSDVSESGILCKQFLTERCGLVLAHRQQCVGPQQGASDDGAEVPGGAGGGDRFGVFAASVMH